MLSGKQIYNLILGEIEHRRSYLLQSSAKFSELKKELGELLVKKGELFNSLAALFLPNLENQSVDSILDEVGVNLEELKKELATEQELVITEFNKLSADNKQLHKDLQAVSAELDSLASKRDALEEESSNKLKADKEFVKLCEELAAEEGRIRLYKARLQQINQEREKNIKDYEENALFMYLYNRNFLLPNYQAPAIFSKVDGFVAKATNYKRNLESYQALKYLPKQMEEEITKIESEKEATLSKVDGFQKELFSSNGLMGLVADGEKLATHRKELQDKLNSSAEKLKQLEQTLSQANSNTGSLYSRLIKILNTKFPNLPINRLEAVAKKTPTREDDSLVKEISRVQAYLTQREKLLFNLNETMKALREDADLLEDLAKEFTQKDYDSERSTFAMTKEDFLDLLADKDLQFNDLWEKLQKKQSFRREWLQDKEEGFFNSDFTRVLGAVLEGVVRIGLSEMARGSYMGGGRFGGGGGHSSDPFSSLSGKRGFSSGDGF
jgi:chromosome segregation ATPase